MTESETKRDLRVVRRPLSDLHPSECNARTHSPKQILQIAKSIERFGFNNPVLVDRQGNIIAGHGRVRAAQRLGWREVPTITLEHLTVDQKRAYIIADNRLAELAGWDRDILSIELQNLLTADLDFDVTDVGFETAEIDLLLQPQLADATQAEENVIPCLEDGPPITRHGDLWYIGEHRIYCGNALLPASFEALMGADQAQMIFTDPPYNVPVSGHVSGLGKTHHREFAMASGEMSEAEFTRFLTVVFRNMAAASMDGSLHFICMDWRHLLELLRAGRIAYSEYKNLCVWAKTNGGMGTLYRSQHELVAVFKSGSAPHINNVELGRHGRNRTNLWTYAGLNSFHTNRDEHLAMHPTVKPLQMVADAILDCSDRRAIILDPFAGSGTTLLAAHQTGRRCYAIELDPRYVDVALRRLRSATGLEPKSATGVEFRSLEAGTPVGTEAPGA